MRLSTTLQKISFSVLVFMATVGLASPLLMPYDPGDFSFEPLLAPSLRHLLGTDGMGQDLFSGLLAGFRTTMAISLAVATISLVIAIGLATLAAYYRGGVDRFIVRLTDVFIIVPDILVIMIFAAFAGPSVWNVVLVMSFFTWSRMTRILREKATLVIDGEPLQYTLLMKGNLLDVSRKMLPYLYPAVVTLFIQQAGRAAVYEATLAFLGIGDPTAKSWGRTINAALGYEGIFWDATYVWWLLPPIVCLIVFVLALAALTFEFDGTARTKAVVG